jgi:hypothetical protein
VRSRCLAKTRHPLGKRVAPREAVELASQPKLLAERHKEIPRATTVWRLPFHANTSAFRYQGSGAARCEIPESRR